MVRVSGRSYFSAAREADGHGSVVGAIAIRTADGATDTEARRCLWHESSAPWSVREYSSEGREEGHTPCKAGVVRSTSEENEVPARCSCSTETAATASDRVHDNTYTVASYTYLGYTVGEATARMEGSHMPRETGVYISARCKGGSSPKKSVNSPKSSSASAMALHGP